MSCNKCDLHKYCIQQCMPKGAENPVIYVVGEAPGPEENKVGLPFVGRAGKYITELMNQLGLTEQNCRFFNVVRCYPQKSDEDTGFRAPNDEEIQACSNYLIDDIIEHKPKVIIPVGGTAAKFFLKENFSSITRARGTVYNVEISGTTYPVVPTYHPSYLMRQYNNDSLRNECISDFKAAMQIALNEYSDEVVSTNKRDYEDDTDLCRTYAEFDDFCKRELDNADRISYDIETNAEPTFSNKFEVVGFSLASRGDKGSYTVIKSLDYEMPKRDVLLVKSRIRKLLTEKNCVLTYNCLYELPGTLNWANIEINHVFDVFVMVKLMVGDSAKYMGGRGLKAQCSLHLGYKDWSKDLDIYLDAIQDLKHKKGTVVKTLLKYYNKAEVVNLMQILEQKIQDDPDCISRDVVSYGLAPYKLIGKYGGIDAEVLFPLYDYYEDQINKMSAEMNIDLHKGLDYWMKHHLAAYVLERNGAYWDEQEAQKVSAWCRNIAQESLAYLVSSPLTFPWIKNKVIYNEYLAWLRNNKCQEILGRDTIPKRITKNTLEIITTNQDLMSILEGMSLSPSKTSSEGYKYKLAMGHFEKLSEPYRNSHAEEFDDFAQMWMDKYMAESHSVDEMKALFNPMSNTAGIKAQISEILITPAVRYARIYDQILMKMEAPDFDIDAICTAKWDSSVVFESDKKLLTLVSKLNSMDISQSKKLEMFSRQLNSSTDYRSWMMKNFIKDSLNYKLDSTDDNHIIDIYRWYTLTGVDIEDESTWNDNFRWLYNYRMFKKSSKMISVYIDGAVGHQSVYCADKESLERGDLMTKTCGSYKDHNGAYILHTKFSPCAADTGRWKATMHVLPSGRTIKRVIKSRFPGGVVFCPDCSQAEVRTLARVAQDKNLMDAFENGLDIHRYVACLTGDTEVLLADGSSRMIKDLVDSEVGVACLDKNNEVTTKMATNIRKTKSTTKIVEVTLDNGEVIRCTPEHLWLTKNGYIEAKDLEGLDVVGVAK